MSKKVVFEVIAGVLLLGLLVAGIAGFQAYRQPLAEPLSLVMAATETPSTADAKQPTPPPTVVPSSAKTCGMSGSQIILVIGRDEQYWEPPYGADAIRVVKVDYSNNKVEVFAFPRDLLLKTPSLEAKYNIKEYRLGPLYTYVRQQEGDDFPQDDVIASDAIAQVLYDNFGVAVDEYMTIEENVLPEMIDVVGGVEVNVKEAITSDLITVKPGKQTMNGRTAMLYSRYLKNGRASEDEWGRLDRQASVFQALADKLFQPKSLLKATDLFDKVKRSIVTDLSPQQIVTLACMGKEIKAKDVEVATINKPQMNILADETMIIKDEELGKVKSTLDKMFGMK